MDLKILEPRDIGDRIREFRLTARLSQQELGTVALGKDNPVTAVSAIRCLENGEVKDTSWQKMAAIAAMLAEKTGIPANEVLDYFMGRTDSITFEVRHTLRVIEGEGKPDYGVPSSKSRSRRALKEQRKAAGQTEIRYSLLRHPEQLIWFERAA